MLDNNSQQSILTLIRNVTSSSNEVIINYLQNSDDNNDQPPLFDPRRQTQTLFKVQLYVCSILGLFCFLLFCYVRSKFPLFYSIRSYKNNKIRKLPKNMFSWVRILISINNDQLLQVVGLESYVFLCFFRMSIRIFFSLSILGLCILSPIRYFMTGSFDRDNSTINSISKFLFSISTGDGNNDDPNDENSEPALYLAISVFFTYVFSAIVFYFLFRETNHIIKTRQKFLGSQRSLTDRTIVIKNIPKNMRNEEELKFHIQDLNLGKVDQINFVYDYTPLVKMLNKRVELVNQLEMLYSKSCGLDTCFNHTDEQRVNLRYIETDTPPTKELILYNQRELKTHSSAESTPSNDKFYVLATLNDKTFNKQKRSCMKTNKSKKEQIDKLSRKLIKLTDEINHIKQTYIFKRLPVAFISMDSVTDAQMAAQAVFSPKVFELVTELAPAPHDVIWDNLIIDNKTLFLRKNIIELIIILFSCLLIIPTRYITSLLNVNAITKMWKELGDYLMKHDKARTIVTGLLPTYLFSIINAVLPYVISSLSNFQGLGSMGDVELSVIKKNFLYIFFNLFLVFTLFGTLSSYKALLTDTTKIAPLLATSIKSLSLFYIDLIILQGFTMFPFKLLQIGDLSLLFWRLIVNYSKRTPRVFRETLYRPPLFDLGLILPQHMLIFIITILYSSISTKILISGLVYFILGFYTYKYQLVYSLVHPYHSTGKSWPVIFKRVCLGVFILHLQMFGSLALEQSFVLAGFMLPLFPTTLVALMFFDRHYQPLLHYIALDAIKTCGRSVESESTDNALDELFTSMSPSKNVARKNSIKSIDRLLDGYENSDAVILSNPNEHSNIFLDENVIDEGRTSNGVHSDAPDSIDGSHLPAYNMSATSRITINNSNMRRRCSTIEEEREATQSYVHPCLLDNYEGLLIGWENDKLDYLRLKIVSSRGNEQGVDDINTSNHGATIEENNVDIYNDLENEIEGNMDRVSEDLENAKGDISGYVTRVIANEEIW